MNEMMRIERKEEIKGGNPVDPEIFLIDVLKIVQLACRPSLFLGVL
jgi:hypothetical protein